MMKVAPNIARKARRKGTAVGSTNYVDMARGNDERKDESEMFALTDSSSDDDSESEEDLTKEIIKKYGCLDFTTIVAAIASDAAAL